LGQISIKKTKTTKNRSYKYYLYDYNGCNMCIMTFYCYSIFNPKY